MANLDLKSRTSKNLSDKTYQLSIIFESGNQCKVNGSISRGTLNTSNVICIEMGED